MSLLPLRAWRGGCKGVTRPRPPPQGELPGLVLLCARSPWTLSDPLAATGGAGVCSNVTVRCHMLKGVWQRP